MDNKDFLLKTLQTLEKVWPPSTEMIKNLQENNYDEKTIDFLAEQMRDSISEVKDESIKKQLWKSIDILQKISEMEKSDDVNNKAEVEELENMLDNL